MTFFTGFLLLSAGFLAGSLMVLIIIANIKFEQWLK